MTEPATGSGPAAGPDGEHWAPPWTPEQRESFHDAIARNQRASWQVAGVTLAGAMLEPIDRLTDGRMAPTEWLRFGLLAALPGLLLMALAEQGASVQLVDKPVPPIAWLIGVPIGAVLVALMGTVVYLLMVVSVMLSALFTMLPAAVLHALLR